MTLFNVITLAALVMSIICFLVFLLLVFRSFRPPTVVVNSETLDSARRQGAAIDPAKIAEAFAKLADSLAKAGPLVSSLVGSMFFMLVAVFTAQLGK
jgi:hypothetical protein